MDSPAKVVWVSCLVNTMDCNDYHSPRRMGPKGLEPIPELRFSGVSKDAKIPPIDTMAIKNGWNLLGPDFRVAVGVSGASFSGRDLLPPMPWIVYKNLNDEDLSPIYHFLKKFIPAICPAMGYMLRSQFIHDFTQFIRETPLNRTPGTSKSAGK